MNKPKDTVKETAQQKALAEVASQQMADYKKRWLPVQQRLAETIKARGKADSAERVVTAGKAATDSAVQFGMGKAQVADKVSDASGGLGSGRAKMAIAGTNTDEATSRGLGFVAADQEIDDAYLQGLGQLAAIGKGERAGAIQGMGNVANMSGRQARADAELSAQRRAGNAELIGQVAGFGFNAAMNRGSFDPQPDVPEPAGSGFQNMPGSGGFKASPSAAASFGPNY